MVNPAAIAGAGAKSGFVYLKVFSFILLFAIISLGAILHSIQQKSVKPLIEEVGGNIVMTTNQLAVESNKIIDAGGVVSDKDGLAKIWDIMVTYATFIILLWMTFVWIKLFSKIYERSPLSYDGNFFANYMAGFLIFILFQIIFGFFYGAMLDKLHNSDDALRVIYTPVLSIYLFLKAAYLILLPATDVANKIAKKLPV